MDHIILRDNLSVTGVHAPSNSMAVGGDGQLIFKDNWKQLVYYDIQDIAITKLNLSKMDPLYSDCQIYAFSYVRGGNLLLVLQREFTNELFICEGIIDTQERLVDISGSVYRTKIFCREGRTVSLVHDEAGVVLVSYPIRWKKSENTIELFHASKFLQYSAGEKYTISMTTKDKILEEVFSNHPFISRNFLYLFYASDSSKFLLVPLSGNKCGKCEVRSTQGIPPCKEYLRKPLLVFEDFVLLYAHMNTRNILPNFYMLNLTNLKWCPLNLSLSHHYPTGKVSFEKASEDLVYLHGDCNMVSCSEKSHLYQIPVDAISALTISHVRSNGLCGIPEKKISTVSLPMMVKRTSSMSQCSTPSPSITGSSPFFGSTTSTKTADPPIQRYRKKQEGRKYSAACKSVINGYDDEKLIGEPLKRSSSCSTVHWGSDMAEQCGSSMQAQMKKALEMGYPQQTVMDAFSVHGTSNEGEIRPFESVNNMLDVLQRVSGRGSSEATRFKPLSIYDEKSASSNGYKSSHPRSASVSRSSSFSGTHLNRNEPDRNQDLTRIINALDKEKERDRLEYEQQFSILKNKIHELESTLDAIREEKHRILLNDQENTKLLQEQLEKISQLESEAAVHREKIDKLTIINLKLERDVDRQKELVDHRREQYQNLRKEKEKLEEDCKEEMEKLRTDLEIKKSLLDEQTSITKRLEDQKNSLQSNILLEKIAETSSIILQKKEEHAAMQREILENSKKHHNEVQEEMEKIQELYQQVVSQLHTMQSENEEAMKEKQKIIDNQLQNMEIMSRKMTLLLEKASSECCICLSTKPNVVFQPCRHLVVCTECSKESTITECPTCRSHIDDTLTVYT